VINIQKYLDAYIPPINTVYGEWDAHGYRTVTETWADGLVTTCIEERTMPDMSGLPEVWAEIVEKTRKSESSETPAQRSDAEGVEK
jgi:hypothetical protein